MQADAVTTLRTQNETIRTECADLARRIRLFTDNQSTPPLALLLFVACRLEEAAFLPGHLDRPGGATPKS